MFDISLDIYQTTALGAVILVLGLYLVKRSETLRKFCIPAAVAGGLVFALINTAFHYSGTVTIEFDSTMKNVFMMAFFCSVGFMASFRMLKTGGRAVITLLILVFILLLIQDVIGPVLAVAFGLDAKMGLCLGSISLVGGHGTAASYGETLVEEYGLEGADVVAIAAATFGLAFSGFIGGPLARNRVRRHSLRPSEEDTGLAVESEREVPVKDQSFLAALILMAVCIGAGTYVCDAFSEFGVTVPVYLGSMILALIVRNVCDLRGIELPMREISALGGICLTLFLSMALMTMELWQLEGLAAAMVVTLLVQTVVVALFAYFVVFRCMGGDYDSAAYLTATCGFGLGATPNAMANLDALTKRHGPAPRAYFVVPIVGSVFIDFLNTGVLTAFINIL